MSFLSRGAALLPAFRTSSRRLPQSRHYFSSQPVHTSQSKWAIGVATALATGSLLFGTVHLDTNLVVDSVTDQATGIEFPATMRLPVAGNSADVSLLGVGVRTVSFIKIKVYSVGFYADLSNPNIHLTDDMTFDEKIEHIVRNTACVVRIVPTRDTSHTHLRDAFVRAAGSRMQLRRKSGQLDDDQVVALSAPIRRLKSIFPNTPLKKHASLDVFLTAPQLSKPRSLIFRDLGSVDDSWVGVELILHYFDTKAAVSPPLLASVTKALA
ncbi:hypothetical protein CYLTODRAFT_488759 [Cylindrobasidium torrendii FP15055 ss-10]|uniref:Chalcone isomerase domain-containing protein n=1 Tax=Cylindrobasidium torrendii FP15055 ss-10 TaxID=1314674 RepID=A0A0D7BJA3_9AGAR|nr:hypothetical protein CYLTODRAFT_488759 [Cylindrobasidium torrendii FP15055 ss-10]